MVWADNSKEYRQQARPQSPLMQQNYEWDVPNKTAGGYIGLSEYHRKADSHPNRKDAGIERVYLPSFLPGLACIVRDYALGVIDRAEREIAEGTIEGNILRLYRMREEAESADRHIRARMMLMA